MAFCDSTTASFCQAEKGSAGSDKLCVVFPGESCPSLIHFPTGSASPIHQPLRPRLRQKMLESKENT